MICYLLIRDLSPLFTQVVSCQLVAHPVGASGLWLFQSTEPATAYPAGGGLMNFYEFHPEGWRAHRRKVEQIIPKYAPWSDGNDELAYCASIEHAVDTWRRGEVWV